jgi:hypothetical protein
MSYAEFLVLEARADQRHEFLDGHVFAMDGGSPEHGALAAAFIRELGTMVACWRMKIAAADIRAFVQRDRLQVQREKRLHWARVSRGAPSTVVALSHALYEHARTVSPAFASEASRDEDFLHHLRLKGLIDRAARALPVRRGSR